MREGKKKEGVEGNAGCGVTRELLNRGWVPGKMIQPGFDDNPKMQQVFVLMHCLYTLKDVDAPLLDYWDILQYHCYYYYLHFTTAAIFQCY